MAASTGKLGLALMEPVWVPGVGDHCRGAASLAGWIHTASLFQGGVKLEAEKT